MKYIIDFKNDALDSDIQAYLSNIGASVHRVFNSFEKTFVVECSSTPQPADIVDHIISDDEHPLQLLGTIIQSDKSWGSKKIDETSVTVINDADNWWKSYVIARADLDSASYQVTRRGSNTTVYVLDSGIDVQHPEFESATVSNLWSFTGSFNDTAGHGTAIASVISGKTCGLSGATIKSVKIFDANTPTKQSDLLSALDAISVDVVNNPGFSIINCSWAIPRNTFIETKFQNLIDRGIFVIAAAGNSGTPISDCTPASMADVITIGSYNHDLKPSDFSDYTATTITSLTNNATNHGELDGWAPGENIKAALVGGGFGFTAGTSIAAGIHSAVFAVNAELFNDGMPSNKSFYNKVTNASLSRADLLDLSDPKYANSVNRVSTATMDTEFFTLNDFPIKLPGVAGEYSSIRLFNPRLTDTVEILNLPSEYTVTPTGYIYGVNPQLDTVAKMFPAQFRFTLSDGTVVDHQVDIAVRQPYFDPETETTGDPILDIRLRAFQCSGVDCYPQACFLVACGGKSPNCYCLY